MAEQGESEGGHWARAGFIVNRPETPDSELMKLYVGLTPEQSVAVTGIVYSLVDRLRKKAADDLRQQQQAVRAQLEQAQAPPSGAVESEEHDNGS